MTKKREVVEAHKTTEELPKHLIISTAEFLVEHMGEFKKQYWTREARRKGLTLTQMIVLYLCGDFGMKVSEIEELKEFTKKKVATVEQKSLISTFIKSENLVATT